MSKIKFITSDTYMICVIISSSSPNSLSVKVSYSPSARISSPEDNNITKAMEGFIFYSLFGNYCIVEREGRGAGGMYMLTTSL